MYLCDKNVTQPPHWTIIYDLYIPLGSVGHASMWMMDVIQKRVIVKNLVYLEGTLHVDTQLLAHFIQEDIITEDEEERITKETTHMDQSKKLLRILLQKDSFNSFIKVLKATKRKFIVTRLLETKEQIEEKWTQRGKLKLTISVFLHYHTTLSCIDDSFTYQLTEWGVMQIKNAKLFKQIKIEKKNG